MIKLRYSSPISDVKGVGKKYKEILESKGLVTVGDFVRKFPAEYIDPSELSDNIKEGVKSLYSGTIKGIRSTGAWKRGVRITIVDCIVSGEDCELIFFNQPYLKNSLNGVEKIYFMGKAENAGSRYKFTAPLLLRGLDEGEIKPLYRKIGHIGSGRIEKLIRYILDNLDSMEEMLPERVVVKNGMPSSLDALKMIHFPKAGRDEVEEGHYRFKYLEFFFFWLELEYGRSFLKPEKRVHKYRIDGEIKKALRESVPFELTSDQKKSVKDIFADLKGETPMSRLLLGDVGTGKTVVAFISLMVAVMNGYQGALLAPTEILVDQHFGKAEQFFKDLKIARMTAGMKAAERRVIIEGLKSGEIDVVFGTHALLSNRVEFKKLSLVVIDEQHRFGVAQRAAISYKGERTDTLVMTATPIPRTLMLSIYKDLDLSVIKEKPADRKAIATRSISAADRESFYSKLKDEVRKGEKVYIVLPLVEESEFQSDLMAVERDIDWYNKLFGKGKVGAFTGRTSSDEKRDIMDRFHSGELRVLVSTTVIEVGIDVPDATVMVIENADRYGMAQLHQLRGRVGRGKDSSSCFLIMPEQPTEQAIKRVDAVVNCSDGFTLAEEDLKNRGGGEILGFAQSGGMSFSLSEISEDYDIFKAAEEDVLELSDKDYTSYMKKRLAALEEKLGEINFS